MRDVVTSDGADGRAAAQTADTLRELVEQTDQLQRDAACLARQIEQELAAGAESAIRPRRRRYRRAAAGAARTPDPAQTPP